MAHNRVYYCKHDKFCVKFRITALVNVCIFWVVKKCVVFMISHGKHSSAISISKVILLCHFSRILVTSWFIEEVMFILNEVDIQHFCVIWKRFRKYQHQMRKLWLICTLRKNVLGIIYLLLKILCTRFAAWCCIQFFFF